MKRAIYESIRKQAKENMRSAALGVAILWVVVALAAMAHVSFAWATANLLIVFIALTGGVFLALVRVRYTRYRLLTVLATIAISAAYLATLWVLALGLAFDPWIKPDVELRQGALTCRAVYFGERTELKVFETFPLGIERRLSDDMLDDSPEPVTCKRHP
ncbi:hypothetical protein [Dyella japonica]|uniref:Uncharacterized protein n=1 Tax=Dyella japonica DSM 16301 TaxID=1440762 RepID=A0A0G9H2J5_9GAMM|nr:hypothetical protein [Dyella japonica]KLD63424.1 hypothetical protein Y882_11680 [Dyella japonica DSM 16301]